MASQNKNLRWFSLSFFLLLTACDVSPILTALLDDDTEKEDDYPDYIYTGNSPVISEFTLTPGTADTNTDLTVNVTSTDYDYGDVLTTTYSWYVNNTIVSGETTPTLSSSNYTKSDVVKITVSISDGTNTTTDSLSVTISDAIPALEIVGDASAVNLGSTLSFKLNTIDPDGDPLPENLSFNLVYGPNGMTVDNLGNVSWTPNTSLFTTSTPFNWGISASSDNVISKIYKGTTLVNDPNRKLPLSRSAPTISGNPYNNFVGDLNNDGVTEILTTDDRYNIFTLIHKNNKYQQEWLSPFDVTGGNQHINAVNAADINNDDFYEIFIATSKANSIATAKLIQLDGKTRLASKQIDLLYHSVNAIKIADLDKDSTPELILLVSDSSNHLTANKHIEIRNLSSLELIWSSGSVALGSSLSVGNIDNDNTLEIITSAGYVYGVSDNSYANEWIHGSGFGNPMVTGDINNDGISEIIGLNQSNLTVTSALTKSTLTEYYTGTIYSLLIENVDNDTKNEIIAGDFSGPSIYSYDDTSTPTLTKDITGSSLQIRPSYINYIDVDDDGQNEYLLSTRNSTIINSSFTVAGANPTFTIEWQNTEANYFEGPFAGGKRYTLAPENNKLVFYCKQLGHLGNSPALLSMDPSTGEITNSTQFTFTSSTQHVMGTDYDADGVSEFLINTSYPNSSLSVVNFLDGFKEWNSPAISGTLHYSDFGDMNNDGFDDFITLIGGNYSKQLTALNIYDALNSTLLWNKSFTSGEYSVDVLVRDLYGDSSLELILATSDALSIYKKSGTEYILDKSINLKGMTDVEIGYLKDNSQLNIVVHHYPTYPETIAQIRVFDTNLIEQASFETTSYVSDITIESNSIGNNNLLISQYTGNYTGNFQPTAFYLVDPYSGDEIMHSPSFTSSTKKDSVQYIDLNYDGVNELIYSLDYSMNFTR